MSKPTVSGRRVVLVLLSLIALWGIVLAVLVWRGSKTAHYTRVREKSATPAPAATAADAGR